MADVEEIGDGDYKLDVGALGQGESLNITISNLQRGDAVDVIFSSIEGLSHGAVRVVENNSATSIVGDSTAITGSGLSWSIPTSKKGCVAIVVNGELYARVALYDSTTTIGDCMALPLPICAYREGESIQPIAISNNVAQWPIYSPNQPTRIVGFNLPTDLRYHLDSSDTYPLTADGGDFGIEFTTPSGASEIIIFNESFWLYLT